MKDNGLLRARDENYLPFTYVRSHFVDVHMTVSSGPNMDVITTLFTCFDFPMKRPGRR
jgi:hypothetical protein